MVFMDVVQAILEVGFPVALSIYLLWEGSRILNRFSNKLVEIKIGLYLILQKLDIVNEYEEALKQLALETKKKE